MRNVMKQPPIHAAQKAIQALVLSCAVKSETPSDYRIAKMTLLATMLENRDYEGITAMLKRSPSNLEYFEILLKDKNFSMNTGGKIFDRVQEALLHAYENGADLSSFLPVLKERLTATYFSEETIEQSYAALEILSGFIESTRLFGKPSQTDVAQALLHAAVSINLDPNMQEYQGNIIGSIQVALSNAVMCGVVMSKGAEMWALGMTE